MAEPAAPAAPASPAPADPKASPAAAPSSPASAPDPKASAPAPTGKTIADLPDDGTGPDGKAATAPATWPDDWRDQIAGGDEKSLGILKRYNSPQAVFNALRAAQQKISSGELKKGLSKDATPEEIAAYRKDNGVPEKPDGYELPKGIEFGDEDKPVVDSFLEFAHSKNMTPAAVQETISWWSKAQDEVKAKQSEADGQYQQQSLDALNAEWGKEFRGNINALKNWATKDWPDGLYDNLLGARMANGKLLGDDPTAVKFFVTMAKEFAPAASLVGSGEYQGGKGLMDRKAEIEKMMRTDRRAYDKDESVQKEYLGILRQIEKADSRTKAA